MNLQPIAAYFFPNGWGIGYSGNILANWKTSATNAYTVPIGIQISKVTKFGALPGVKFALAGQWMPVHPESFGQVWSVQLLVQAVRPRLLKGYLSDPAKPAFLLGEVTRCGGCKEAAQCGQPAKCCPQSGTLDRGRIMRRRPASFDRRE